MTKDRLLIKCQLVRAAMVAALILVLATVCAASSNCYGLESQFYNLKGKPQQGKVKIAAESYRNVDGELQKMPKSLAINAGQETSYIPVITNLGQKCSMRFRIYANTGQKDVNILGYCYGINKNIDFRDGWFYYNEPLKKNESIKLCQGFAFPDVWQWQVYNKLEITVEAEAVADEEEAAINTAGNNNAPENAVKTGDESNLALAFFAVAICIAAAVKVTRREGKNGQ